jgi:hypothetical protein
MRALLRPALAACLFAAAPAAAAADGGLPAPIRFEIGRAGRVLWRGELEFRPGQAPMPAEAKGRFAGLCAATEDAADDRPSNRLDLDVSIPRDTRIWRGRREYHYDFHWSRAYGGDPRRLDAYGDRSSAGSADSHGSGYFFMGRHGRVVVPLPDDLTLTFRR